MPAPFHHVKRVQACHMVGTRGQYENYGSGPASETLSDSNAFVKKSSINCVLYNDKLNSRDGTNSLVYGVNVLRYCGVNIFRSKLFVL